MYRKICNSLVVIENGMLKTYMLDDKLMWDVGRPTKDSSPDIKLYSPTASRKHGRFQNIDGSWFYTDYCGKNGTVYNNKKITSGMKGRKKPIMLTHGDILVFGGGEETVINNKTIWALFCQRSFGDEWRVEDTSEYETIILSEGENDVSFTKPVKGEVIEQNKGIAIYMGDVTYLNGRISISGK